MGNEPTNGTDPSGNIDLSYSNTVEPAGRAAWGAFIGGLNWACGVILGDSKPRTCAEINVKRAKRPKTALIDLLPTYRDILGTNPTRSTEKQAAAQEKLNAYYRRQRAPSVQAREAFVETFRKSVGSGIASVGEGGKEVVTEIVGVGGDLVVGGGESVANGGIWVLNTSGIEVDYVVWPEFSGSAEAINEHYRRGGTYVGVAVPGAYEAVETTFTFGGNKVYDGYVVYNETGNPHEMRKATAYPLLFTTLIRAAGTDGVLTPKALRPVQIEPSPLIIRPGMLQSALLRGTVPSSELGGLSVANSAKFAYLRDVAKLEARILGKSRAAPKVTVKPGDKVYRVYGGDSKAGGASWSPVNPADVPNYRSAAGLPSGGASGANNTGRFVIEGTVKNQSKIVKIRPAEALDGHPGGLPEYIIPDWMNNGAVKIKRVSGANPEF